MDLEQVKLKARELKSVIETKLKEFREQTGYTPNVDIETKVRPTNTETFVNQTVSVTLTIR